MAKANPKLIKAIKKTIQNLESGEKYQWGHMGSCNCGHLAQELTNLNKAEIHEYALRSRSGDWAEQVSAFCPQSGLHMDIIIDEMLNNGLTRDDLIHLERLSDDRILKKLPKEDRYLKHNNKADVVKYFKAWVMILEEDMKSKEEKSILKEKARFKKKIQVRQREEELVLA